MFDVGSGEVILIMAIALLLFGGRLPEVARSVGRAIAAVRKGVREGMEPVTEPLRDLKAPLSDLKPGGDPKPGAPKSGGPSSGGPKSDLDREQRETGGD